MLSERQESEVALEDDLERVLLECCLIKIVKGDPKQVAERLMDIVEAKPGLIERALNNQDAMEALLDQKSRLFEDRVLKLKGGIVDPLASLLRSRLVWKTQNPNDDASEPLNIAFERDDNISTSLPHVIGRLVLADKWNVAAVLLKLVEKPTTASRRRVDWMNSLRCLFDFLRVHGKMWDTRSEEMQSDMNDALQSSPSSSSSSFRVADSTKADPEETKEEGGWDDSSLDDLLGDGPDPVGSGGASNDSFPQDSSVRYAVCCKRICSEALLHLNLKLCLESNVLQ